MNVNDTIRQLEIVLGTLRNFKGDKETTQIVHVGTVSFGTHYVMRDGGINKYPNIGVSIGWVAATYIPETPTISIRSNKIDAIEAVRMFCKKTFGCTSGIKITKDLVEDIIPYQEIPELKEKLRVLGESRAQEIMRELFDTPKY